MQLKDSPTRREEQSKLIAYLDQFGKQISSRKNSNALEEQLSSLSKAYNQAQEKLLDTERALMNESVLLEKQRSVIEIYKHILGEDMQDEGILNFIQEMEEEEEKKDIYQELESIRVLLGKKKRRDYKKTWGEDKTIKQLRKEVNRLEGQRESLNDESSIFSTENEELKSKIQTMNMELEQCRQEMQSSKVESYRVAGMLEVCQRDLERQKGQSRQRSIQLQSYRASQSQNRQIKQQFQSLSNILTSKLNIHDDKQNKASNSFNPDRSAPKLQLQQLETKLSQLMKYKVQYKKLKENSQNNQFLKQQVLLLKLFLSDQALQLFKEYEEQKLECIETELRNLSVMDRNKVLRLEQCERDIWKYRMQLMREDECNVLLSTAHLRMTNSLQSQPLSSTMPVNLIESMPAARQAEVSNLHNISQFMPDL